jgi:mitochondrial fission 1 protein
VRDARYLEAVGAAKAGDLIAARRSLTALLAEAPEWRQAASLKAAVDDAVIREGLTGLGVAAGVLGVLGVAIAAFSRR